MQHFLGLFVLDREFPSSSPGNRANLGSNFGQIRDSHPKAPPTKSAQQHSPARFRKACPAHNHAKTGIKISRYTMQRIDLRK